MANDLRNVSDEYERLRQAGVDATVSSYNEAGEGFQAFAAEMTDYSKKTFDRLPPCLGAIAGAKTIEQAFQIQSQYAKNAYDAHMVEMKKLGEMSTGSRGRMQP